MGTASTAQCIAMGLFMIFGATAQPAGAQDVTYRFGLQANLATPTKATIHTNDLYGERKWDDFLSSGFGASAFFELGLSNSSSVRARLEYLAFGDSPEEREGSPVPFVHVFQRMNYDMTVMGLAADYAYSIKSLDTGPYIFGGLGYYGTKGSGNLLTQSTVSMPIPGTGETLVFDTPWEGSGSSLGLSIGAGYRFTKNLGCEARFTTLNGLKQTIKNVGEDPEPGDEIPKHKIDLDWLQVSLCYRF
jgi:hypothetical protein